MDLSGILEIGTLNCIYFAMVVAGLIYALGLLFLGQFGDGDHDVDGADFDHDVDSGGLLGDADLHIFSPIVVATFVTVFGASGLIVTIGFGWDSRLSLVLAAVSGASVSLLVAFVYSKLLTEMHGTTQINEKDMVGRPAQVTTPIPADGLGAIIFEIGGERVTRSARSCDRTPIGRGTTVIVEEIIGGVLLVRPRRAAG